MQNYTSSQPVNKAKTHKLSIMSLAVISALSLSACGGGGGDSDGGNAGGGGSTPNDAPPTVTAENFAIISSGNELTLTASATDPDGDAISYSWRQISGAAISNSSGFTSASASFSAPEDVDSLVLEVTATANGRSDTAQVQVLVVEDTTTAIFVDAEFTGTSTGSIDAPFTNLANVLSNLSDQEDVYIKTPSGDERLSVQVTPGDIIYLNGGNSIYGGFSTDWSRDIVNNRTGIGATENGILYQGVDLPTVVSGVDLFVSSTQTDDDFNTIGVYASQGSASFTLDNATVVLEDFDANSIASIEGGSFAVYFNSVDTTVISNSNISAGNAKSTTNRGARTTGKGRDGVDGEDARVGLNIEGGDAGASSGGGWNGGRGGNAGNTSFEPGENGMAGSGRTDPLVRGGSRGIGGFDADTSTPEGRDGLSGGNGDDGVRGNTGTGGTGFGRVSSINGVFARSSGDIGSDGYSGGGGGGGGGASAGSAGANGGAGGGGGEGGDGGEGGLGALAGFTSIGIHIAGGNSHEISNNQISSGNGGRGGIGGTGAEGGDGGIGGDGVNGTQGFGNAKGGLGGNGGDGGKGGRGGSGGSGGGGPSFAIFIGGSTPANITNNTITTGNGGAGGSADFTDEPDAAGRGGWSVGIFDGDTNDSLTPVINSNTFTLGEAGQDGNPRETFGQRSNTNL